MCMEDVRLGRKAQSQMLNLTLSTTVQQILPPDPYRLAIVIGGVSANLARVGTSAALVSSANGIVIGVGTFALTLDVKTHGDIVTGPWFAASTAGTPTMSVLVSRLQED